MAFFLLARRTPYGEFTKVRAAKREALVAKANGGRLLGTKRQVKQEKEHAEQ